MSRLIWSRLARHDLYTIAFDEMLWDADRLIDRIEKAPLVLLDFPELGPVAGSDGLRKWHVRRTPFLLLYKIRRSSVEISRVVYAASDWKTSD